MAVETSSTTMQRPSSVYVSEFDSPTIQPTISSNVPTVFPSSMPITSIPYRPSGTHVSIIFASSPLSRSHSFNNVVSNRKRRPYRRKTSFPVIGITNRYDIRDHFYIYGNLSTRPRKRFHYRSYADDFFRPIVRYRYNYDMRRRKRGIRGRKRTHLYVLH